MIFHELRGNGSDEIGGNREGEEDGYGVEDGEILRRCTYSNCKAAILLGKPVTRQLISQGLNESRDVLTAPPLDSPLCCLRRRTGLGVLPTYSCAWRMVERSR